MRITIDFFECHTFYVSESYKVTSDPFSEISDSCIAELMVLGFISLLLTFGQNFIVKICIPEKAADTMLPCPYNGEHDESSETENRRRLLWYDHRVLAAATYSSSCKKVSRNFPS